MGRPPVVAVVAIVSAFVGGTGALVLGKATGWVEADTDTVVLSGADGGTPVVERQSAAGRTGKPLAGNGFDPERIYRERADGVVTVIALFGAHADTGEGGTAQGSGFVASRDGYVLT